jgi:hypothetical protein
MVETVFWKATDKTHPDWRYLVDVLCLIYLVPIVFV